MSRPIDPTDRIACADVRDALPELVAGDAPEAGPGAAAWSARLWRHLHSCSACRREFSAYRESHGVLEEIAPATLEPVIGDDWFDRLADDIVAATVGAEEQGARPLTAPRSGLPRQLVAAAAVLLLCLTAWGGWAASRGERPLADAAPDWVRGSNLLDMPALWTEADADPVPVAWTVNRSRVMPVGQVVAGEKAPICSGLGARVHAEEWIRHVYQVDFLLGATVDVARAAWR